MYGALSLPVELDSTRAKRMLKLMHKNEIKKFVRKVGSEERAIEELMILSLRDSFYNDNKDFIWRGSQSGKFTELDYYASRKLQALYWILKIYSSEYLITNRDEFCYFLDDSGETIWDYQDLNPDEKAYYYKVVVFSPTNHKGYFDRLGYISVNNKSYKNLETSFRKWFDEMRLHGLKYMRDHGVAPIESLSYRLE